MVQDYRSETAGARKSLILEPIVWSDGYSRPDDYYLIKDGQRIGRICRMKTEMELWCWVPTGPRGSDDRNGGVAYSLDEAEAAVEAAWERRVSRPGSRGIISMRWAGKVAVALLAITAIVAAIVVPNLFGYSTTSQSIGVAIGFFVGGAALFVLPLWLILRIAVWVTRAFGAEGAGGLPARLALDGLVHREDTVRPLAGIKATAQRGVTLHKSTFAKFPGHVGAVTRSAVQRGTSLLNGTLPKLLGHVEIGLKATVQRGVILFNGTFAKFPGHVEAVTKSTLQWGTDRLNGTLPKFLGHVEAAIRTTVQWGANLRRR
ncbi:MAG TPA: hypothetical protein VH684_23845 [Xanthobacteraceae bacterium]|jgi:hypothetical protein